MTANHTLDLSLRSIANKIYAAEDIDEALRNTAQDICTLFHADRLTLYGINEDRSLIVSKFTTGLEPGTEIKLPMSAEFSIAGYVALTRRVVNLQDAYDVSELNSYDPPIYFYRAIDRATGYRTKQVLAAPLYNDDEFSEVVGVVQLFNTLTGVPFPKGAEARMQNLCKALSIGLRKGERPSAGIAKTKYDHLVIDGVITPAELDLAIRLARSKGVSIEQELRDELRLSDAALGIALSKFFGLPYEPFRADRVRPATLLRKLKRSFVVGQGWAPVAEDGEGVVVVTTDPERVISARIVKQLFPKKKIAYSVCTSREFSALVDQFYGPEDSAVSMDAIMARVEGEMAETPSSRGEERVEPDSATVQLVNKMVVDAHKLRASDIHIEPRQGTGRTRVRFRIDGSLSDYIEIPASSHAKVVARIKIMSDLDISNRREPQDGKIAFKQFHPGLDIELRVATIPTAGGKEDVVLRLLTAGKPVPIAQLGLSQHTLDTLKAIVSKPYGLFLVCGPTGSGKTTTLHSILDYINTPETKIWTAEDPVEITHENLRQVQINLRAELTFARAMRAFLRADPDVIMVGEMRDRETTAIGIEASLTGHRVFATIHTNSAVESIVRLLDMGMDPFNFADALIGIMAQRLAKRLCSACKKPHAATPEEVRLMLTEYCMQLKGGGGASGVDPKAALEALYAEWRKSYAYDGGQFIIYEPGGCEACRGTGYNGRLALHELLPASDGIRRAIQEHARASDILVTAINEGMRTLKQDGIEKVLQGITSLPAVRAVCMA